MARIKVADLRYLLNQHMQEKISFSKIVERLNEIAAFEGRCKNCNKQIDLLIMKDATSNLCTACFTSNS